MVVNEREIVLPENPTERPMGLEEQTSSALLNKFARSPALPFVAQSRREPRRLEPNLSQGCSLETVRSIGTIVVYVREGWTPTVILNRGFLYMILVSGSLTRVSCMKQVLMPTQIRN